MTPDILINVPGDLKMNYVLCGPPGSGKTTYAKEHMRLGDIIIDLDAIFQAFTGLGAYNKPEHLLPFMLDIHRFAIQSIQKDADKNPFNNAWVIVSGARRGEREYLKDKLGAEIIVFDVPAGECLQRIETDPNRAGVLIPWGRYVKAWWDEYEP